MRIGIPLISLLALLSPTAFLYANEENSSTEQLKTLPAKAKFPTLIFVQDNSNGQIFKNKIPELEAILEQQLTGTPLKTLNSQLILQELNTFIAGTNAEKKAQAIQLKKSQQQCLFSQSSASQFANLLDAKFILVLSLSDVDTQIRDGISDGVPVRNIFLKLNAAIKLYDAAGACIYTELKGEQSAFSNTQNARTEPSSFYPELLKNLTQSLSKNLKQYLNKNTEKLEAPLPIETFAEFNCILEGLEFPQARQNKDGTLSLTLKRVPVSASGINLQIDGIDYPLESGHAQKIKVLKNRPIFIKITSDVTLPLERTLRITENKQALTFRLKPKKEVLEHFLKDLNEFVAIEEQIKAGNRKDILTEAEAQELRGKAKAWENAKIRISDLIVPINFTVPVKHPNS